jgi:protein phosphatase
MRFGIATVAAPRRQFNEDNAFGIVATQDKKGMVGAFGVIDGMGGTQESYNASQFLREHLEQFISSHIIRRLQTGEISKQDARIISIGLELSIQRANEIIIEKYKWAGATLTIGVIVDSRLYIAHIGDTRLYVVGETYHQQLTTDHIFRNVLYARGYITAEERDLMGRRLYRAVGQSFVLEVEIDAYDLGPKSRLLLCTDGLYATVKEEKMLEIVRDASSPQSACHMLLQTAETNGFLDDTTAVVVYCD